MEAVVGVITVFVIIIICMFIKLGLVIRNRTNRTTTGDQTTPTVAERRRDADLEAQRTAAEFDLPPKYDEVMAQTNENNSPMANR